jgi:hypothetical protein
MTNAGTWNRVVCEVDGPLDPDLLRGLVDGDYGVVVLKGLLPSAEFALGRDRIQRMFHRVSTTQYVNGALTTIGPFLARYLSDVDAYFADAKDADALSTEAGFDLDLKVRDRLREVLGLRSFDTAQQPDGQRYARSIVRIHADGVRNPLHNDNIMRDGAGTDLSVAGLLYQLSCVVCVQECDEGGELKIYRKPWEAADEKYKIESGLGYDNGVVAGVACQEFKPEAEDVYLINPTYYHEIERVGGADRLTLGFFFGFSDNELTHAVSWS